MATSAATETSDERLKRLYGDRLDLDRSPPPAITNETSEAAMQRVYGSRLDLGPGLDDMARATARGAAEGALRDAPVVGGAVAGFAAGMPLGLKAAPFLGPFAAAIPLTTTAAGMFAGYKAGQEAKQVVAPEADPRVNPFREGGITFGSSLASAPFLFGLPVAGPTAGRLTTFLSELGKTARRNPKTFLTGEAAVATSMGTAGGVAEENYPGQAGVRFGAEVVGAVANPATLLVQGVDVAKTALSSAKGALGGQTARTEKRAVDTLLKLLEQHGENPDALVKALRAQLPSGVPTPTAGQKTGSQALMNLEASLGSHRAQFAGEIKNQGEASRAAYQLLIENLERTGDPNALRAVAEMNKARFDNMLQTRLEMAEANAAAKISKITRDTPEARQQVGIILKNEVEKALGQARETERKLWEASITSLTKPVEKFHSTKVPMQGPKAQAIFDRTGKWPEMTITDKVRQAPTLAPSATVTSFLERASQMGPAVFDEIPKPLRNIMSSFGVDQDAVARYERGKLTDTYLTTGVVPQSFMPKVTEQPIKNLVDYRSTLLGLGRKAAATGDRDGANFINSIAGGMMRDLDTLQDPAYDQARQFSRSLNDTFTRTYANTLDSTVSTGANRIAPEVLVERAFSGGADQTALRMQEIENAVGFMRTAYRDAVKKFGVNSPEALALQPMARIAVTNVASVRDAHNRVLRMAASEAMTPVFNKETGETVQRLNTTKLNKFVADNKPLLDRLGITGDLENATRAANLLAQASNPKSILNLKADNQAKFGSLLAAESPTIVVTDALGGKFPVRDIKNLVEVAKKAGPDAPAALDGLKTTILDYAYTKAGGNSATKPFSVDAFEAALFSPLSRNQPSLANIMRANGLMTLQEMSNLKKLITPMQRIEAAARNNVVFDDLIAGADTVTELGLRVGGSAAAGQISPAGPGSLIAAQAGSKAMRQIFDAMPNATVRAVLENAAKDPAAMALLLRKASSAKEEREIANGVINLLGSYGVSVGKKAVTPALNYQEAQLEQQPPNRPQAASELRQFNESLRQTEERQRQQRQGPPAPSTRGVPGLNPAPSAPSQPGASNAPASSSARSQYQSLFPFDSVSPMVGAQQQPPAAPR
jgi:hypothetical protein